MMTNRRKQKKESKRKHKNVKEWTTEIHKENENEKKEK